MCMIWYIKKKGCVQLFEALYVGGNSSKWAILCFHRVEEHPSLSFYRMEEHVDDVVYQ